MGMFDSFVIQDKCPVCGEELCEIQTKQFICDLEQWKIGDKITFNYGLHINSGEVIESIYCDCSNNLPYEAVVIIEGGRFYGYTIREQQDK